MNAPSKPESTALATVQPQTFDLSPRNFEEAWRQAEIMADSDLVPKDFKGKPGNCLIAVQWGAEIGLKSMQSVQNIAVINGRPSLWGDAMLALVRASPLCKYVIESDDGTTATCRTWRHGEPQEQVRTFSMDDAKTAGLAGKQGPWGQYPKRMRQMRARAFLLRDVYTDVIKGLHMAEEAMDMPPPSKFMGEAEVVQQFVEQAGTGSNMAKAFYTEEAFKRNLPSWTKLIESKKKSVAEVIATVETKAPMTEEQKKQLHALAPKDAAATQAGFSDQPQDAKPAVTYAQVAERMNKAEDLDQLAEAATLIAAVADETQRGELSAIYERRGAELG